MFFRHLCLCASTPLPLASPLSFSFGSCHQRQTYILFFPLIPPSLSPLSEIPLSLSLSLSLSVSPFVASTDATVEGIVSVRRRRRSSSFSLFVVDSAAAGELNNDGLFDADISCSRRLRFDLIYLILTRLMSRQTGALQEFTGGCFRPSRHLTEYVSYARNNIHSQLSDEAAEELTRGYVEMRRREHFPVISKKVEMSDVMEAFRLLEVALQQSATDHSTDFLLVHFGSAFCWGYVGIHSSGFRDFLLKPELLRAIVDSGFEHPSEGKFLITPIISASVVFRSLYVALAIGVKSNSIFTIPARKLVWCHIKVHKDLLKNACPHIPHIVVVGTPGRILGLARDKDLGFKSVRHFIVDECDKMLESLVKLLHVDSLSRRFHNFGLFQSVTALKYYIQPGLDSLEETRKTLLDKLLEIDEKMGNPREEDIEPVKCCPNCQADGDGLCVCSL
ncbi:hypothetical protein RHMOL_Rhmol10G0308100 [Rhododendron molle]|uniref:Uncharacterized protein n=1 Tax=Rhododendron molle TaxID=49168 RepID=A0ACC0M926_RHOML|nr:hypothetical protein RHMOL_Rhmol10G0308100 [Rhododendron molle]